MSEIDIDALLAQAYAELASGKPEVAALWSRVLVAAFASSKAAASARRVLAVSTHLLGDQTAALAHYEGALASHPEDVYLLSGYGELLLSLERFDDAAQALGHAIALDPTASHPAAARARVLVVKLKRKYRL